MEKESFESETVAHIMNEHFVNVKVDREERPDVDRVYMSFVQVTSGGGGWPMSVFLTPDLKPIAGGTYFPPEDNYGRPGFKTVLFKVAKQWKEDRQKVNQTGTKIVDVLKKTTIFFDVGMADISNKVPSSKECSMLCFQQLAGNYESMYGGFGLAPKFPQPSNLDFLLHLAATSGSNSVEGREAAAIVEHTLWMMQRGGIHDHVAQGFARYSTDEKWHVPHFEKMLYDQGQLAVTYSNAYLYFEDELFAETVHDILTYVSRDLSHPEGGFYSAEDADSYPVEGASEKKEGAFCVWTHDEISQLLSAPLAAKPQTILADLFCHHYHVKKGGNVDPDQDPHNELTNQNVLIVKYSEQETADKFGITVEEVRLALAEARKVLFEARLKRPRPHLDNKIITAWNGLMISGYAHAANALNNEDYKKRAIRAAEFIKKYLYDREEKKLLRSCYTDKDGSIVQISSPINGFLDDYAFLIRGLIDLYQATWDGVWLEWAHELQSTQDALFWDNGSAAYFSAPNTLYSQLLFRLKDDQDGAEPSGNSVSVDNLLRLAAILDSADFSRKAAAIVSLYRSRLTSAPAALPYMTQALATLGDSLTQVIITGSRDNADTQRLLAAVHSRYLAGGIVILADGDTSSVIYRHSQVIRRMKPINDKATAYVCRKRTCSLPVTTAEQLTALLAEDQYN
ncbi:spermatogenesis-associated protein 20 isoform X3 [Nilaparvata lugens]|nr:spermatogenesis-associated protein 20 isoform X3 [Nilaparvata lugens]